MLKYIMNYSFGKNVALCGIPLCQPHDLRCSSLKIKRNLTPFAVVVHLIQVDSGGDFLFVFGLGFAFQPDHMKHSGFCQQTGQVFYGFAVGSFCAASGAALKEKRQFFKGQPSADGTDPSTGHTDGVSLFQKGLFPVIQFFKCFSDSFSLDAVPENLRIVPVFIPADILAGFFAVLVLYGLVKRNTASVLIGQRQKLRCGFT